MKFGFTKLSIIPVRAENKEQSEMVTQLLFGDIFTVLSEKKNWLEIQIESDQYLGWIDKTMFFEISETQFNAIKHSPLKINKNLVCYLHSEEENIHLVRGSSFYQIENHQILIGEKNYKIEHFDTVSGENIRKEIIETAKSYLSTPYLWGGKTPFGIDCSGFSQMVYKINSISIPRDASQQVDLGVSRNFIDEASPGDLAFFDNEEGNVIHVGIIMEGRKIIHASGEVRIDRLDHQGIFNVDKKIYTHKLRVIQNIIGE
jgi:hypothetical protein